MLVAFYIEVGLLFMVLPWSTLWERNFFMERLPQLHDLMTNDFVRGAVTGLGVLNFIAGFAELLPIFTWRARHDVGFGDEADTQVRP